MAKNNLVPENDTYILPSSTDDMKTFVEKFKIDMMEHIVDSIELAVKNKLPIVELFQFKDSDYVITIATKEYDLNLEHIRNVYQSNNMSELCPRIEQLREILKQQNEK